MNDIERRLLSAVQDQESFIGFIRYLADQRHACERNDTKADPMLLSGAGDWEYDTISGYLDAVAARGESSAGYDLDDESRADNPWRRAARILLYGKYYE